MAKTVAFTAKEDGPRVVVTAVRPDDGRGLYKAWLCGPTGRYLLGTMIPEGKTLEVKRTLSISELRHVGAWPPQRAEEELVFLFPGTTIPVGWQEAGGVSALLRDKVLSRSAGAVAGALLRRDRGGFWLAVPFCSDKEFPLTPIFCFAHIHQLGAQTYAVFCFTGKGWPCFPNNGSERETY